MFDITFLKNLVLVNKGSISNAMIIMAYGICLSLRARIVNYKERGPKIMICYSCDYITLEL